MTALVLKRVGTDKNYLTKSELICSCRDKSDHLVLIPKYSCMCVCDIFYGGIDNYYIICTKNSIMYYFVTDFLSIDCKTLKAYKSCHSKCRDPIVVAAYSTLIIDEARTLHDKLHLLHELLHPDIIRYIVIIHLRLNEI